MAIVEAYRASERVITIPELIGAKYAFVLAYGNASDADYPYFVIKDNAVIKVVYYVGTSHAARNALSTVTYDANAGTITVSSASNDGLSVGPYTAYIFY